MDREIKFSGFSSVPSDHDAPDGDLAGMLDLIPEDGALKPVFPPKTILECNLGGVVKLIHHVPAQDNYIIIRQSGEGQDLLWLPKTETCSGETDAILIASFNSVLDIEIIGNTIAVATDRGMRYALWKDGSYTPLGDRPPFIPISFGSTLAGTCDDRKDLDISFDARGAVEDSEENSNAVWGLLLSSVAENISSKGRFYLPYFVRYAYRLFDGSYSWHSAPILMLPSVIPPLVRVAGSYLPEEGTQSVPSQLSVPYFSLDYKIVDFADLQSLENWKDIVTAVDIFVSAPVYTFDQSKRIAGITDLRSVLIYGYSNWVPEGQGRLDPDLIPSEAFVGHYRTGTSAGYVDHFWGTDTGGMVWKLPLNEKFHDNIRDNATFYKIASISVNSLKNMDSYETLPLEFKQMDSLVARPALPDDYRSHCALSAGCLFAFNSRLNLARIQIAPAPPFPLKGCAEAVSPVVDSENAVAITVFSRINGELTSASVEFPTVPWAWNLADNFPRYIFYPDSSAYKMVLSSSDTEIIIDLTPHDFLNGAFWYAGMGVLAKPAANADPETLPASSSVSLPNRIYTSEVNNPFIFPAQGINSVGNGSVFALSSAAKALSQGQFGQFPLYAFTSEGVWALEVADNGMYVARQPISRDVCVNPRAICQIDSAVLFPSDRGVMLLSGSNTTCISDSIGSETPFPLAELPSFVQLLRKSGHSTDQFSYVPFSDFIRNCRIVYDYSHQRIYICGDENHAYAYAYSLKSKQWGFIQNIVIDSVNSYPEALAMTSGGLLVDFSRNGDNSPVPSAFAVSRPLKLGLPYILKTADTVILRGNFRRGHVMSLLYGSRDLIHWNLVWSSKTHFLRGFRGSPYKYFRLALLCRLDAGESVCGASFQFTPRLANRPR